jgi:hypothetical protein
MVLTFGTTSLYKHTFVNAIALFTVALQLAIRSLFYRFNQATQSDNVTIECHTCADW